VILQRAQFNGNGTERRVSIEESQSDHVQKQISFKLEDEKEDSQRQTIKSAGDHFDLSNIDDQRHDQEELKASE